MDSGQVSGGQGLLVVHAAKMAKEGKRVEDIVKEMDAIKSKVNLTFLMPNANIFSKRGRAKGMMAQICDLLQLHPMGEMKQSKAVISMMWGGTLDNCRAKTIRWSLRHKKKIQQEVVYLIHAGCSVKELEMAKREILQQVSFERVEVLKASFSTACNVGVGTLGLAFLEEK